MADIVDQNVKVIEVGVTCSGLNLVLLSNIELILLKLYNLHNYTTTPQVDEIVVTISLYSSRFAKWI